MYEITLIELIIIIKILYFLVQPIIKELAPAAKNPVNKNQAAQIPLWIESNPKGLIITDKLAAVVFNIMKLTTKYNNILRKFLSLIKFLKSYKTFLYITFYAKVGGN